jgi:2-iminoacetate synthase
MLLYAPLYVSNYCINHCTYCGFRHPNSIERIHLDLGEVVAQARILESWGMRQVLMVAGDYPKLDSPDYLCAIVKHLTARGLRVSIEIAPQSTGVYAALVGAGASGLTLYQETYDEEAYSRFHPRGTKTWFDWRLEAPDRAAEAGMPRLGLGILLGLADPRADLVNLINHGRYLEERFGDVVLAFSLPRIHEAPAGFVPPHPVDDDTFVRMYCALRLNFPRAHLVLSTRESPALRSRLALSCITQMSAGSSTAPGGYEHAGDDPCRQQFPVADHRSPAEVVNWLEAHNFAVCWDSNLHAP